MKNFHKLFMSKVFAILLTVLFFHGPSTYVCSDDNGILPIEEGLHTALKEYRAGAYESALGELRLLLPLIVDIDPVLKAKVFLVLGACYEKSGNEENARECFLEVKKMREDAFIDQIPQITTIDGASLSVYREVFAVESLFKFENPVTVSEMMNEKTVHAPRKSVEEKEKEKKRKKFPWLIAIGAVIVIGIAAVLLLTSKSKSQPGEPEITWVHIPAGEFLMGDNFAEGAADELPVHSVYLDEYYISKYEITFNQYSIFCGQTGESTAIHPITRSDNPYKYAEDYPTTSVSWDDARAFCTWLSEKTGENIQLPTEAQWEKAARGVEQIRYPWGNEPPNCSLASYSGCGGSVNQIGTAHRVGHCPDGVSPYGVFDMAGNVSEWCRDWYHSSYYSVSVKKNPLGPPSGSYHVVRGGSILSNPFQLRSTYRGFKDSRSTFGIGFRIVKER
ncbi:MAG: formylglycine-generating enzyme family protein [Candidatus Aminicenantes bacterium]|nr:formylglycine-generating enzyme family protein [Candidatus Aminicenantes bacterium]